MSSYSGDGGPYGDIVVEVLTDEDVYEGVNGALAAAGCTWPELRAQAAAGRFDSELMRTTWFAVSGFAENHPLFA